MVRFLGYRVYSLVTYMHSILPFLNPCIRLLYIYPVYTVFPILFFLFVLTLRFSAAHGMSLFTKGVWDPRGAARPTGARSAAISAATATAAAEIHVVAAAALSIVAAAAVVLPSV